MTEKFLSYRGDIKACAGAGKTVLFVTLHPEKQPTAIYRLHVEGMTLEEHALPAGAVALVADGKSAWAAGSDQRIYFLEATKKKPTPWKLKLEAVPTALALLSDDLLAILAAKQIVVTDRGGKPLQTIELPETGTALAADPNGQWLIAGTEKGTALVFEREDKEQFLLSESEKLHEGAVTALLFEPEELRFFSAGLDQKLLLTHARGKLEPEDRGRSGSHEDRVTAMILGLEDRIYTAGRDATVKNWQRSGAQRPATQKDGVAKVVDLTLVDIHQRPHLVAACEDNSLRFFLLDPSGKIGQSAHKVFDAYAAAENELSQSDPARREKALRQLAAYNDSRAIELIANCIEHDGDHGLRLLATQLLGESGHARAAALLEKQLKHGNEAVRLAALQGLRKLHGEGNLDPLEKALAAGHGDVGKAAVKYLEGLAEKDDQALARLKSALDNKQAEVRRAALLSLEAVVAADSPAANLQGLRSQHADVRSLALTRLLHRQLLDRGDVQAALRQGSEDKDSDVRRKALLVSLCTRDALVKALRARDAELHRQLHELETFSRPDDEKKAKAKKKDADAAKVPKAPAKGKLNLKPADYDPLLQAIASRAIDTCLAGGRFLSLLGDARAFGLLLQLSREENAQARVEVCRSLAALQDPRSVERLATLLRDQATEVRDAAFSALAKIYHGEPLSAAEIGLSAGEEDVCRRGLQLLIKVARTKPPKKESDPPGPLLQRALSHPLPGIRSEALKAVLNIGIAGGGEKSLRFAQTSIHEDVRREVLTEVIGQFGEDWAPPLLLDFLDDPAAGVRSEAFEFATKKFKRTDLAPLERGLASRYGDTREQAVQALSKKRTAAAQKLLVEAINDAELQVRQRALDAILAAGAKDVVTQAMSNQHIDIRLRAARARAIHGDLAAREPLLTLATQEEPEDKIRKEVWVKVVEQALTGLGMLGDPTVLDSILPMLQSKHAAIRKAAAEALVGIARPEHADVLREALSHDDAEVKYRAALALAFCGEPMAQQWVLSTDGRRVLDSRQALATVTALGKHGEDRLIGVLDGDDDALRRDAMIVLLLRELLDHDGTPRRCVACLSSRHPRVRLLGARALQCFGNDQDLLDLIVEAINDREGTDKWEIPPDDVRRLGQLLIFAPPHVVARTADLFRWLDKRNLSEDKQDSWNAWWQIHVLRYAAELSAADKQAAAARLPKFAYSAEQLDELAFGAYVGLVRQQGATS